jgi:alkane 1-monooxygenase
MGFWRFFPRALAGCLSSAWGIERDRLARKGRPVWDKANPFWRYAALAGGALGLGGVIGGWFGVALVVLQAFVAVLQLEAVNYVEHYGLRRALGPDGRPERVQPRHSWNASHSFTNWLMINLQRHSDHHCHPDRRYPLLAAHGKEDAPQLPFGYPIMAALAYCPPAWRRVMDKRVLSWRARFYPGVGEAGFG